MSWSRSLRTTTVLFGLIVVLAAAIPFLLPKAGQATWWSLAPLLVLVVTWATAPRAVTVGGGEVRVERNLWWPVRIALAKVEEIGVLPPEAIRRSLRAAGNGGLFGYTGRFRSPVLGFYAMYATRGDRLVGIRAGGRVTVVTPDDVEPFVDAVVALAPRARPWGMGAAEGRGSAPAGSAGAGGTPSAGAAGTGAAEKAWWIKIFQGALFSLPVLALAGMGAIVARAPREVRLEPGAVVVERRLWPAERFPVQQIRAASVLPPEALVGSTRVRGSAVMGALEGVFESPVLGRFEIYAPHTGLVLLETARGNVVVGVIHPERFREELAAQIRAFTP